MRFIVALVLSFALIWACAKPLKKHPVPFYVGAYTVLRVARALGDRAGNTVTARATDLDLESAAA